MDNYSAIPSRVRAVLYNERKEEVINCLASSIRNLIEIGGAQKIIVGCHTAHIFLPQALKLVGSSDGCVINIIDAAVKYCRSKDVKAIRLLASEGTVQTGIYKDAFAPVNIEVIDPSENELIDTRTIIEDVKQNKITKETRDLFASLTGKDDNPVLLGCSELPVIYGNCVEAGMSFENEIIDPFQVVIDELAAS